MDSGEAVADASEVAGALRVAVGLVVRKLRQAPFAGELTLAESSALSRLERGGPATSSDLAAADLLNELCLSLSPTLAGPGASRIIAGQPLAARRMKLAHVLAGADGFLFFRYFAHEQDQ